MSNPLIILEVPSRVEKNLVEIKKISVPIIIPFDIYSNVCSPAYTLVNPTNAQKTKVVV